MTQEGDKNSETQVPPIESLLDLARELGFIETDELVLIRKGFESDPNAEEKISKGFKDYAKLAEAEIDKLNDEDFEGRAKAQIGVILTTAAMCFRLGRRESYLDALDQAMDYAHNITYNSLIQSDIFANLIDDLKKIVLMLEDPNC